VNGVVPQQPDAPANASVDVGLMFVPQTGFVGLQAKAAGWMARVHELGLARLQVGSAAMPLWGFVTLLVGLVLLMLAVASRLIDTKSAKAAEIDPFERLLQRRLAQKAHEEKAAMMNGSALRA
jgi:hypothetical protein